MSSEPRFHVGFRTSIIALVVGIVLFVGLALVYLSFARVTSITRSAAISFLRVSERGSHQAQGIRSGGSGL